MMCEKKHRLILSLITFLLLFLGSCNNNIVKHLPHNGSEFYDVLNYKANPKDAYDRNWLAFSDQGAWFAYGFPVDTTYLGGFAGPLLMTQENGIWSSKSLSRLHVKNLNTGLDIEWKKMTGNKKSFLSHLEQEYKNDELEINQLLFFISPHTALFVSKITNTGNNILYLEPGIEGDLLSSNLHMVPLGNSIKITSDKSTALGEIRVLDHNVSSVKSNDSTYLITLGEIQLTPGESMKVLISQSFVFPRYDMDNERKLADSISLNYQKALNNRISEKNDILNRLQKELSPLYNSTEYKSLLAKTVLTLQNNWRIPAGELKYSGFFPSYHYVWFHGFWAWDSWKHAVAASLYNTELAKDQIRAMYDFMDSEGFIADCIYRDTTIENHNYRNTKPPLSAWAIWKVFEQDNDTGFLEEMYPNIIKQHNWWYTNRDHDVDGICEYGSTDGTLIAAKWESGMDNAVRFDGSKLLKNSEHAYSLDQESVDLNSYLYAEKIYMTKIAEILGKKNIANNLKAEASKLKNQIRKQFYDSESGWFYDTSIDGHEFIYDMGCEGWIPLWANVADTCQAESIVKNIMDTSYFNVTVPLQTLSAAHSKFKPDRGYWRGPTWIDQSYFGIVGLGNYGYEKEANLLTGKLLHNAEGLLSKGPSIRENYNPITGKGMESENFSWSAAHYLLLLTDKQYE
jgi:glucosidase